MRSHPRAPTVEIGTLAAVMVCTGLSAAGPTVKRLSPSLGQVGHEVVLEGSYLAGSDLEVTFGRAHAILVDNPGRSKGVVRAVVPNKVDPRDPDTVEVTLLVDGVVAVALSGPLQFTYAIPQPLPSISDLTTSNPSRPKSVLAGQPFLLTLVGSNFLTARRAPERCIAQGDESQTSGDLLGPVSDTMLTCSFPGLSEFGDYEFWISFSDGSGASIAAPDFVQEPRIFGLPPTIQSVNFQTSTQQVILCDFSSVIEGYLCSFGILGARAEPGVFIGGTYTDVRIRVVVTDPDSTPTQSNVLLVAASYIDPEDPREVSLVLFDDGSANKFLFPQKATIPEDCSVDPFCTCSLKRYLVDSNDSTAADAEYTRGLAFVDPAVSPLLQDCIMQQYHQTPIRVPTDAILSFKIEAVDRQGNLSAWPNNPTTGFAPTTIECTGDECGCCLLLSSDPVAECQGKSGMPSDDFPAGVCISVF